MSRAQTISFVVSHMCMHVDVVTEHAHRHSDVSIMQVCTHAWIQSKNLNPQGISRGVQCDNDRLFQMCCCGPAPGPPRAFDILDRIVAGKGKKAGEEGIARTLYPRYIAD